MSTFLWVLFAVIYVSLFLALGLATLRRGHWLMFLIGIIVPIFWVIGAFIPPTERALMAERGV
jgi:hypothetical protein